MSLRYKIYFFCLPVSNAAGGEIVMTFQGKPEYAATMNKFFYGTDADICGSLSALRADDLRALPTIRDLCYPGALPDSPFAADNLIPVCRELY